MKRLLVSLVAVAALAAPSAALANGVVLKVQRANHLVAVTSTGLSLTRVASGTSSTDTSVTWAGQATLQIQDLGQKSEQILIANNTAFDSSCTFRIWNNRPDDTFPQRHIEGRRSQVHRAFVSRECFRAHVNHIDGNRRIIGAFNGQQQFPLALARLHGLARDERRPYPGAFRQSDFEELAAVVAKGQREFGHHLSVIGHDGCEARVVHQGLQHIGLREPLHPDG